MSEIIKCPVCNHLLSKEGNTFKCENNHTFDLAKEGYLNLLLNAKKTSGDSKEMMAARRDFLAKGYYEKLSDRVNQRLMMDHCRHWLWGRLLSFTFPKRNGTRIH